MKIYQGKNGLYWHWCPGCQSMHKFYVDKPTSKGARWSYNGNPEKPSFHPSMHISVFNEEDNKHTTLCHYFLKNGVINFLGDSTNHKLRDFVPLPEIPKDLETLDKYYGTDI